MLPADVTRKGISPQHGPLLDRKETRDHFLLNPRQANVAPLAVGIGSGVSRQLYDPIDGLVARLDPRDLSPVRSRLDAARQLQLMVPTVAQNRPGTAQAVKLLKHQADGALDFQVGVEHHLAVGQPIIAHGQVKGKFTPASLI